MRKIDEAIDAAYDQRYNKDRKSMSEIFNSAYEKMKPVYYETKNSAGKVIDTGYMVNGVKVSNRTSKSDQVNAPNNQARKGSFGNIYSENYQRPIEEYFGVKPSNSSTSTPNNQTTNQQGSSIVPIENTGGNGYTLPEVIITAPRKKVANQQSSRQNIQLVSTPNNQTTNRKSSNSSNKTSVERSSTSTTYTGNAPKQEVRNTSQRGRTQVRQSQTKPQIEQPRVRQFQVEQPTQTQQPVNGQFIPSGFTTNDAREAVKSTIAELNPQYMDEPGRYSIETTLNRGDIRRNRNLYRNVDEYYNWLNSDEGRNSDDYKLFGNTGLWASNLSEEMRRAAFDTMMNYYGINRNLGRRDSGRLANLLNNLSQLGNNSDMRGAFVDAYNNALDEGIASRTGSDGTVYSNSKVRDLFDRVTVNPYTRYNSPAVGTLRYE